MSRQNEEKKNARLYDRREEYEEKSRSCHKWMEIRRRLNVRGLDSIKFAFT